MGTRIRILLAFKLLVVVWPLYHLGWTLTTPLSSWKLAGWGMYATPHYLRRGVLVVELDGLDLRTQPLPDLGPVLAQRRVLHVKARAVGPRVAFEDRAWGSTPDAPRVARAFDRFSILGSAAAAGALAEVATAGRGPALVVLTLPRMDVRAGRSWNEVIAFLCVGDRVVPLEALVDEPRSTIEVHEQLRAAVLTQLA